MLTEKEMLNNLSKEDQEPFIEVREINQYQKALAVASTCYIEDAKGNRVYFGEFEPFFSDLEELVSLSVPKKPVLNELWVDDEDDDSIYDEYGHILDHCVLCPTCGQTTIFDYEYDRRFKRCSNCGQVIDWRDKLD